MTELSDKYQNFISGIPDNVCLVAVSKTKPEEDIMTLYNKGHRSFGENKVQDLTRKAENLPKDIKWHMIGHLQTNKVKYIAPFVHMIHGLDSLKLARLIDNEAGKNNRIINCLLQIHIAEEQSKFGLSEDGLNELLMNPEFKSFKNIRIKGLMGMASFTEDLNQVRVEFRKLKTIFDDLKSGIFIENEYFSDLSMGMSDDFRIAMEEGATIIRIGSLIFGERNYSN